MDPTKQTGPDLHATAEMTRRSGQMLYTLRWCIERWGAA
jgi:hypothetical protein